MVFFRVFVLAFLASLAFLHVDHLYGHLHGHDQQSGRLEVCHQDGVRIRDHRSTLRHENAALRQKLCSAEVAARHARRIAAGERAVFQTLDKERQGSSSADAASSSSVDTATGDTRLVDVKRATIEHMLAQPEVIGHVSLIERLGEDGRRGIGLAAIQSGSVFELIGLHNGDILLTLNDQPVDVPSHGRDHIGYERLPDFVDLGIERQGKRIRILVLLHD